MKRDYWKQLKTKETVELFREANSLRSEYAACGHPVSMTSVWSDLADDRYQDTDEFKTKIRFYDGDEEHDRKAGVIVFGNSISLVISNRFWKLASKGERFQNFLLAHEYVHVVRDHHSTGAVIKYFQLDSSKGINANIPPNWEEFEANVGAVFFQCGTALFENGVSAFDLAERYGTDRYYAEKLQRICQTDVFQAEYARQTAPKPRAVF